MHKYDFLVIGSGIAGLTYAIKVAGKFPDAKIAIITKADAKESNTKYAQGGIAVVTDTLTDSFDKHIKDTLKAGDGLCDLQTVDLVIKEGPDRLEELLEWGTEFDRKKEGNFDLGREGGHTQNRILHHKDITGFEIETTLLDKVGTFKNITVLQEHFAVDLITQHHSKGRNKTSVEETECYGAYIFNEASKKVETFLAKITMLATGGIGQVYQNTTNPKIATGDGIAIAYRAKAHISNMEFIQFHPTSLDHVEPNTSFLISEAVRGFGGLLRNADGELFMEKYDPRKELASRDIVSRAIDNELKKSGFDRVYLDCTHIKKKKFKKHFPNIYNKCREIGINPKRDYIPVVPAAHYLCGGVDVNENGQTTIKNLYACGECSNTGLHGANRLASNSLLEAVVFAHRSFLKSKEDILEGNFVDNIPDWNDEGTTPPKELILITHNRKELRAIMNDYVTIIRTDERLQRAAKRMKVLYEETEELYKKTKISAQLFELRNLITVGYLIVKQSQARKENRGAFYNSDLE
ncbi:MAG: L-aspartate oxidase [Cyclobacteriaceae bacterium]